MEGDWLVVGAPADIVEPGASGAAYLFRIVDGDIEEEHRLNPDVADDLFGNAVAILGDTVVVGAPIDSSIALDAGAVYVFKHIEDSWIEEAKLSDPTGSWFGFSVALSEHYLAVGAPSSDVGGAVFLYCLDSTEP